MIITTTAVISSTGSIRLVQKNTRPKKDEIVVNLVLDVPDSTFQPPALTMRATVSQSAPTPIKSNGDTTAQEWTPERLRRLQALLGLSREEIARHTGVTAGMVRDWESGTVTIGAAAARKLAALETQTKGVTA